MSGLADGPDQTDLSALAFHKEKTSAKRLAARTGVTESAALHQVLSLAALPGSLSQLIATRQHSVAQQSARRDLHKQQQADAWQRKQTLRWPQTAQWQGWFDGSASPNPGQITVGAVLKSPSGVQTDISRSEGEGDSNEAEYLALLAVLEEAVLQHVTTMSVYGDSRIVIEDVTGVHLVAALAPYRCRAQRLQTHFSDIQFHWIPRAKNSRADALARLAVRSVPNQ